MRNQQIMSVSCQMFSNFQSAGQSKRELLKLSEDERGEMPEFHNMVTSRAVSSIYRYIVH